MSLEEARNGRLKASHTQAASLRNTRLSGHGKIDGQVALGSGRQLTAQDTMHSPRHRRTFASRDTFAGMVLFTATASGIVARMYCTRNSNGWSWDAVLTFSCVCTISPGARSPAGHAAPLGLVGLRALYVPLVPLLN